MIADSRERCMSEVKKERDVTRNELHRRLEVEVRNLLRVSEQIQKMTPATSLHFGRPLPGCIDADCADKELI